MKYKVLDENHWVLMKKEDGRMINGLITDEKMGRVISSPNSILDNLLVVYNENQVTPYKGYIIVPLSQIFMVVEE